MQIIENSFSKQFVVMSKQKNVGYSLAICGNVEGLDVNTFDPLKHFREGMGRLDAGDPIRQLILKCQSVIREGISRYGYCYLLLVRFLCLIPP